MTAEKHTLIFQHGTSPAGTHYVSATVAATGQCAGPFSVGDISVDPKPLIHTLGTYGVIVKRDVLLQGVKDILASAPTYDVATGVGWHRDRHYVLGRSVFSPDGLPSELPVKVALAGYDEKVIDKFGTSGTLAEWNEHIGKHLQANTRGVFACGIVFAGPLLQLCSPSPCGGFQLVGDSGRGKTGVLVASASIMGCKPGSTLGAAESWRNTPGVLEKIGHCHADGCAQLDEAHHAKPQDFHEVAFALSEAEEKGRMTNAAPSRTARLMFLSTSNLTVPEIMARIGERADEALMSRVFDVPFPSGSSDVYDYWSGFDSGAELTDHLKASATKYYGTPFAAFLSRLVTYRDDDEVQMRKDIAKRMRIFKKRVTKACPIHVSNYGRAIDRGGLAYAALALAIELNVLPWNRSECLHAVVTCIVDGLVLAAKTTGGRNKDPKTRVVEFLRKHRKRLHDLDKGYPESGPKSMDELPGFMKKSAGRKWAYLTVETFKRLVPAAADRKVLMKGLVTAGMSEPPGDGQTVQRKLFPGAKGIQRVYSFAFDLFSSSEG